MNAGPGVEVGAPASGGLEAIHRSYAAKTPKSRALHEEARKYLAGGNSRDTVYWPPHPVYVTSGAGARIVDVDGNEYLDLWNNATSLILGHAHPSVVTAVSRQVSLGSAYTAPTPYEIDLASMICRRVPSVQRIRFTNSGTEAVLQAVRLARAYTGRAKIAKFEGSYHGMYDSVYISVGPAPHRAGDRRAPIAVPDSPGITGNTVRDTVILPYNDIEATRRIIERERGELGAVLVEPIANRMGLVVPRKGFLEELRAVTAEHGIVLIFDEVISFRVAPGGAQSRFGVIPDLTVLGKVIGGGYPIGALGGREELMALFDPRRPDHIHHHGTFNANPVSLAAGLATLRELTDDTYASLERLGNLLRAELRQLFAKLGIPARVTGTASLFKMFLGIDGDVVDYRSSSGANRGLEQALFLGLIPKGIFFSPFAAGCLSTAMSEADVRFFCGALADVLQEYPIFQHAAPGSGH